MVGEASGPPAGLQQDSRDTAEDEHEEGQNDKAADGDAGTVGVVEGGTRHDYSHIPEAGKIEEHVDAGVDLVVALQCLGQILAVPDDDRSRLRIGFGVLRDCV